jgi:hypothetical protein
MPLEVQKLEAETLRQFDLAFKTIKDENEYDIDLAALRKQNPWSANPE